MSLLEMPVEIWSMIVGNIKEKETLATLMLVNKQFYALTIPFLYKRVYLNNRKQLQSAYTLFRDKIHYAEYIQAFGLNFIIRYSDLVFLEYIDIVKPKIKSLFLRSDLEPFPYIDREYIFSQLIELDIDFWNFLCIVSKSIPFPNLKCFSVVFDFDYFFTSHMMHYLGFPFIEYEKFNEILNLKSNKTLYDFFNHVHNRSYLLKPNETHKVNFPRLQKLIFDKGQVFRGFGPCIFIIANVGLPSLQELTISKHRHPQNLEDHHLKEMLSTRPPNFRFTILD